MKFEFYPETIRKKSQQVLNQVAQWTASDIRNRSQRSIKQTRKLTKAEKRKGYTQVHSKPGKPPLSPTGRLKRVICYVKADKSFIIGPEQVGYRPLWKILEKGGRSAVVINEHRPRNKRKFTERQTGIPAKVKKGRTRPSTRPIGKNGQPYQYFWSEKARANAVESSTFLEWCRQQEPIKRRLAVTVEARPFMKKAYEAETAKTRMDRRFDRAGKSLFK